MLPEGSNLEKVHIPRYDKNFNPISFFSADNIKVAEKSLIHANNAYIEIYKKNGEVELKTRMKHATYHQKKSILKSTDKTLIEGKGFTATGTALTIKEQSQQGFLKGPVNTIFTIPLKPSTSSNMHKESKPIASLVNKTITSTLITASSSMLMAERPALLSENDIQQLDEQSKTISPQVEKEQKVTISQTEEITKISQNTDKRMTPFLKKIDESSILISQTSEEAKGLKPTIPQPPANQQSLTVECDGGLYFDATEDVFVYLKNIRLQSPQYQMSCKDELKIYLTPDNKEEKASEEKIKKIIATGDIVFVTKDEKGNTYIARSAEAHLDPKTETVILRGGYPSIQQSANQYLKSKDSNAYIKITKKGSVVTSPGSWENKIIIPE